MFPLLFTDEWLRKKLNEHGDIPSCPHGVMAGIAHFVLLKTRSEK